MYRQRSGGAIGLRATCAIARVTMNVWDKLWGKRIEDLNLRIELYTRYMDDGRIVGYPIRPGWRFEESSGLVKYCQEWEIQDKDLSPTQRTLRILEGTMKGVVKGMVMTMESKEDFDGKWLPTLDISLSMSSSNRLEFKHYDKPTSSNLTLQKRSAMEVNTKMGIMGNEVTRRMFNIGGEVRNEERWETLDKFAVRIMTSGYEIDKTRQILLSGIRGYEGKIEKRLEQGVPVYRTAEESGNSRSRRKIMGKSTVNMVQGREEELTME